MLAQDFLRAVALDALAADIPARDHPRGVQHIERVIGHPLNEEAKITLTFEQIACSLFVFFRHPVPCLGRPPERAARGFCSDPPEQNCGVHVPTG
jgi:hypothetical protein